MSLTIEIWEQIVYKGERIHYEISSSGRVRNTRTRKILKPGRKENGYYIANIRVKKNKQKNMYIHRLVAKAFIDNPDPDKYIEVNHIDGDKSNNNVWNLEWVTSSENKIHAFKLGLLLPMKGEEHPNTEYTDDEIMKACEMIHDGKTNKEISKKLGIKKNVINSIRNRKRWTHISDKFIFGECVSEYNSEFTIDEIKECCQMLEDGFSTKEITTKLGINKNIISKIRHKKAWTFISKKYDIKPISLKKADFKKYWNDIETLLLDGYSRKEIRLLYPIADITENQYVQLIQGRINHLKNKGLLDSTKYSRKKNV